MTGCNSRFEHIISFHTVLSDDTYLAVLLYGIIRLDEHIRDGVIDKSCVRLYFRSVFKIIDITKYGFR